MITRDHVKFIREKISFGEYSSRGIYELRKDCGIPFWGEEGQIIFEEKAVMDYPEEQHLFSISEFSRACGVSRKTLIRMEESGFLVPFRVNPGTGYRYYDAHNAAEVRQYLLLQKLGLSRSEITDYYYERCDINALLKEQRKRLGEMQRILEELEIRHDPSLHFSFSFLDLPEIVCYCVSKTISSPRESESFFYQTHQQSIMEGFRMQETEPLFGLSDDEYRDHFRAFETSHRITACIPVAASGTEDPHLMKFPAVRAFSGLAYGDYTIVNKFCDRFWKEFDKRKLHQSGRTRFIGLLAPYVNKYISPLKFCFRLVVPVEP